MVNKEDQKIYTHGRGENHSKKDKRAEDSTGA